jgi:hypothetical protein
MPAESLVDVRVRLERACERLTSPTAEELDACTGDLESAAHQLTECQPRLTPSTPLLEEARNVRRAFVRAQRLMDAAAAFHTNWMRVRGALTSGYTAAGEPGAMLHSTRIRIDA